jgi:glucans biosynthesis protein
MSNLQDIPDDRKCGAKNRRGEPCRKWTMRGRTRCRNHGGASHIGMMHPNFRHGWYSSDPVSSMMRRAVQDRERRQEFVRRALRERYGWDDARIDAAIERR